MNDQTAQATATPTGAASVLDDELGYGLSVAELAARLATMPQDDKVKIGWSWSTAPVELCDNEDGEVIIEAMLDKKSRMKGLYALCIEDIAAAVATLDAEIHGVRSPTVEAAFKTAMWRIGILLATPNG